MKEHSKYMWNVDLCYTWNGTKQPIYLYCLQKHCDDPCKIHATVLSSSSKPNSEQNIEVSATREIGEELATDSLDVFPLRKDNYFRCQINFCLTFC